MIATRTQTSCLSEGLFNEEQDVSETSCRRDGIEGGQPSLARDTKLGILLHCRSAGGRAVTPCVQTNMTGVCECCTHVPKCYLQPS